MATVFVFGCCVLPFHGVIHRLMPLCHMATELMSGAHHHGDRAAQASMPAPEKQQPVKRLVTNVANPFRLAAATAERRMIAPNAATAYRSFITLGAVRCDRDVGLHVFVETFLI
jgi:hypothetical protein